MKFKIVLLLQLLAFTSVDLKNIEDITDVDKENDNPAERHVSPSNDLYLEDELTPSNDIYSAHELLSLEDSISVTAPQNDDSFSIADPFVARDEKDGPKLVPKTFGCWLPCGRRGGYCPQQCAFGQLCCKKGHNDCPKEMADANPTGRHACVESGLVSKFKVWDKRVKKTWIDAARLCEAWGGNLATISSKLENDFIMTMMRDLYVTEAWIGFNDRAGKGTFKWLNTESSCYTNWGTGEPNNKGSRCAYIAHAWKYGREWRGTWIDDDCSKEFNFVCQRPKTI